MEYWNLVFNEFYSDPQGKLHPLPQKGIDTGAGLERILALLENKESIYDTAEMQKIIQGFENLSAKLRPDRKKILYNSTNKIAFRVSERSFTGCNFQYRGWNLCGQHRARLRGAAYHSARLALCS